jgi:heptaprenylglyceryl phosphate synthase
MGELFRRHVVQVEAWLGEQPNMDVIYVEYGGALSEPLKQAKRLNEFLGGVLDVPKMAEVVDPSLYRQRG